MITISPRNQLWTRHGVCLSAMGHVWLADLSIGQGEVNGNETNYMLRDDGDNDTFGMEITAVRHPRSVLE